MKTFFKLITAFIVCTSLEVQAQWPGHYYAFILKDPDGNIVDSSDHKYSWKTESHNDSSKVMLNIEMCEDNKTWKFYIGYKDMDLTHKLRIEKTVAGVKEVMSIEFPSSLSGGKDKYFRNLYAGKIKFRKGLFRIRLPETDDEWDELKELNLCPDPYNTNRFHDISRFQKLL